MLEGRVMLDNLLAGRTAFGEVYINEREDRSLDFTKNPEIIGHTILGLNLAAEIFKPTRGPRDVSFTHFARKLILFARKGGTIAANPDFLTRVGYATRMAVLEIGLLGCGIGFGGLVMRGMQEEARASRAGGNACIESQISDMAAKAGDPDAPPVVWRNDTGHYALHELAHPFHLWEEGMRLDNCLCRIFPHDARTRVSPCASPSLLWELEYWRHVENDHLRLFSLRSGTARIALLSVRRGALKELQVQFPNEPMLGDILTDVTEYLEARFGVFSFNLARQLAVESVVVAIIKAKRLTRGKRSRSLPPDKPNRSSRRLRRDTAFGGTV